MSNRILTASLNSRGEGVVLGRDCQERARQGAGEEPPRLSGQSEQKERMGKAYYRSIHARARESGAETRWSEGPGQGEAWRSRAVDFILLGMENYWRTFFLLLGSTQRVCPGLKPPDEIQFSATVPCILQALCECFQSNTIWETVGRPFSNSVW